MKKLITDDTKFMKLTPEQIKQNVAAVEAHLNGKAVERRYIDDAVDLQWILDVGPTWYFHLYLYRPKLESKTRPWNCASDIPVGSCYIRSVHSAGLSWSHIISAGTEAISVCGETVHGLAYSSLVFYEYSTDRKTWLPCTVVEP